MNVHARFGRRTRAKRSPTDALGVLAALVVVAFTAAPLAAEEERGRLPAAGALDTPDTPHARRPAALPPYQPRPGRDRPVIAIVAENRFTELTDYVVPYGVLAASEAAEVHALATRPGPVQLFPALRLQPQATIAEFDARFPDGADYVVVPAVHHIDDPTLLSWVRAQSEKGGTLVGVCDGVWVLGKAGLLAGRQAVGHWYSVAKLGREFPDARFHPDRRYLADGHVVTTTGVTASIPVSLALVEAIAGRERAAEVAREMGSTGWGFDHESDAFRLTAPHLWTAARNWLASWSREEVSLPVTDGVDEVALALFADAWSRTYRSRVVAWAEDAAPITSRRGLVILPDAESTPEPSLPRLELPPDTRPVETLDVALAGVAARYGKPTCDFVALQMEYAGGPGPGPGSEAGPCPPVGR